MKKEKKTVKSIICGGITSGHSVDRILKAVAKDKPESKADASHVKYYAGIMKRADEITEEVYGKYANKTKPSAKAVKTKPVVKAKTKPAAAKSKPAKAKTKPAKAKGEIKAGRKNRAVKKS